MTIPKSPSILAASKRADWQTTEPFIWSHREGFSHQDPSVSILRTLLDQPRWLEVHHLYDERGSHLFEQICELPEYYPTRTENAILEAEAARVIASTPVDCLVELGSGSSKKTLHLLQEQIRQRQTGTFAPIDVSLAALAASREIIQSEHPQVVFHGLHARYEEAIASIEKELPTLFIFLGSTVGNFNPPQFTRFFQTLSSSMGSQDYFLLGVDRVKDADILEKAYNDSRGVTAEFILNVLANVNRLLPADFDLNKIRYHSWYNPEWQQIEMYAVAAVTQQIHFPAQKTSFVWEKGDRILVEISRKFEPARLQHQLRFFGLHPVAHFTDEKEWFSLLLFKKQIK